MPEAHFKHLAVEGVIERLAHRPVPALCGERVGRIVPGQGGGVGGGDGGVSVEQGELEMGPSAVDPAPVDATIGGVGTGESEVGRPDGLDQGFDPTGQLRLLSSNLSSAMVCAPFMLNFVPKVIANIVKYKP